MKSNKKQRVGAIIVAAGKGERMGEVDKLFALLGGKPLLARTTHAFQQCQLVDQIVVVVSGEKEQLCRRLVAGEEWSKVSDVCLGGRRRQDSVAAGLKQLNNCQWVVIHDGARPLVTVDLIEHGLEVAKETGAAVAAVPVKDTIKLAGDDRIVHQTPPRQNLWAVQTPQVFRLDIITDAYKKVNSDVPVKLYMGSYDNIKITTPQDLALAEVLWQKYER
jgi:2-C-methyl-D-erythritol 4-phosphate cytidylyltransferase